LRVERWELSVQKCLNLPLTHSPQPATQNLPFYCPLKVGSGHEDGTWADGRKTSRRPLKVGSNWVAGWALRVERSKMPSICR